MKAERQKRLIDYLERNGSATTQDLVRITGASPATVRRDLHDLGLEGAILKTRGGAQSLEHGNINGTTIVSSGYRPHKDAHFSSKNLIAQKAANLVNTGDCIFVGAGMTGNLLCRALKDDPVENVTILTNNITAVLELTDDPRFTCILLGGTVHAGVNHVETLDDIAQEMLSRFELNKVFFTVDGVDLKTGITIVNQCEKSLYGYMRDHCEDTYLMIGHEKLNHHHLNGVAGIGDIRTVITDREIPEPYASYFEEVGTRIMLAKRQYK